MTHDARNHDDRTRLLKSVTASILTAAILIASVSFALIFLSVGSLPYFTLHWLSTLPPARATRILSMIDILARVFTLFLGPFIAVMLALIVRRQHSKQKYSVRTI